MFSSQEEYSFSLTQLMVVLDKPIGLTLAPDPTTGHVYVQHIEAGMSAADSRLVLVSWILCCHVVLGASADMFGSYLAQRWHCVSHVAVRSVDSHTGHTGIRAAHQSRHVSSRQQAGPVSNERTPSLQYVYWCCSCSVSTASMLHEHP
jgi:hypothetical protein